MSTPAKPDSDNIRVLPPIGFLICLVVGAAVELWVPLPIGELPQPASFYTGVALAAVAVLFILLGAGLFVTHGVNPMPNKPAAHLVTGGIYRVTRNPMYVGAVLMLVAIGVGAGSVPIIVCAAPLFLFLQYHVIAREEAYLKRTFGQEYVGYCGKVRRWL